MHYVECFDVECTVVRNDVVELGMIADFDKVIISPGPGLPAESGKLMPFIAACIGTKPLLGICLGLQGIVEHCGGSLYRMEQVAHGVPLNCRVLDRSELLFKNVPDQFEAGMYHSWAAEKAKLPEDILVTSETDTGVVMGIRHITLDVRGLQFHPESIMTPDGKKMIQNWLEG